MDLLKVLMLLVSKQCLCERRQFLFQGQVSGTCSTVNERFVKKVISNSN